MEDEKATDSELTLNGKPVTKEKLDEQKALAEKTGAKLIETKPGHFLLRLNEQSMPLSSKEKDALRNIRLLFGKPANEVHDLFESVGVAAVLSYLKKDCIVIPYIGEIKINYDGDSLTTKGKEAKLNCEFTPSPFLIRNIGQIEDKVDTDIERILVNRFNPVFKT